MKLFQKISLKRFTTIFAIALIIAVVFPSLSVMFENAYAASINVGPRVNSGVDPVNGIYVSTTGNDNTATGSIDAPYKS
ncbi:MAG: hypothetical protein LBI09_02615, partial [Nitrososphaerota archaeon]|nr:hypothetical protein [Nitrososphaerota archaeon]